MPSGMFDTFFTENNQPLLQRLYIILSPTHIMLIADLVQLYTKSTTSSMGWSEYYILKPYCEPAGRSIKSNSHDSINGPVF
jgi:hypothetical protein